MSDTIVGAWRNGLSDDTAAYVAEVEERRDKGFRQLAYEGALSDLIGVLDGYDLYAQAMDEEASTTKKGK